MRLSSLARLFDHPVEADSASAEETLRGLASEDFSANLTTAVSMAVANSIAGHLENGRSVPTIENGQRVVLTPSGHNR